MFRYIVCAKEFSLLHMWHPLLSNTTRGYSLPPKCPYYSVKCQPHEGELMFFFFCLLKTKQNSFPDLQQSSTIERQQTSRTPSCISPTTVWTKRAAIMSGKLLAVYVEQVSVRGRPPDSSLHSSSGLWSPFLSFQLRWPWSGGLWEQMEYECSAEVFEARRKGHHMWVRPFLFLNIVSKTALECDQIIITLLESKY